LNEGYKKKVTKNFFHNFVQKFLWLIVVLKLKLNYEVFSTKLNDHEIFGSQGFRTTF